MNGTWYNIKTRYMQYGKTVSGTSELVITCMTEMSSENSGGLGAVHVGFNGGGGEERRYTLSKNNVS